MFEAEREVHGVHICKVNSLKASAFMAQQATAREVTCGLGKDRLSRCGTHYVAPTTAVGQLI